jgi:hypothetical protein
VDWRCLRIVRALIPRTLHVCVSFGISRVAVRGIAHLVYRSQQPDSQSLHDGRSSGFALHDGTDGAAGVFRVLCGNIRVALCQGKAKVWTEYGELSQTGQIPLQTNDAGVSLGCFARREGTEQSHSASSWSSRRRSSHSPSNRRTLASEATSLAYPPSQDPRGKPVSIGADKVPKLCVSDEWHIPCRLGRHTAGLLNSLISLAPINHGGLTINTIARSVGFRESSRTRVPHPSGSSVVWALPALLLWKWWCPSLPVVRSGATDSGMTQNLNEMASYRSICRADTAVLRTY